MEKKKKEEKEKNKKEIKDNKNPLFYQELQAEPSEENKNNEVSQFMDEEGNIFSYDDLTDEEKMLLHQQLILQKLQEDAEARGEQFNPQEYLAYLEQAQEEEELMDKKKSNKLNKSF